MEPEKMTLGELSRHADHRVRIRAQVLITALKIASVPTTIVSASNLSPISKTPSSIPSRE